MLAQLLRNLADLVAGKPIRSYDQQYQLHLGHTYQPADGDLVITRRPGTDEIYALILTAHGQVAAIEQVRDAALEYLPAAAAAAADHIADYTRWDLDEHPDTTPQQAGA